MTVPALTIRSPGAPGRTAFPAPSHRPVDFGQRPMLVFWETTRACLLACRHCRASATTVPPPGELTRPEGRDLIDQVAGFGRPYPDASRHGFVVRTVEAPFFRRVVAGRRAGGPPPDGPLYRDLAGQLGQLLGPGHKQPSAHTTPTRDGKGIVFIAHDGEVYPAGFLPMGLGNVRDRPLRDIYTSDPLLRAIRAARFTGRCGQCEFADLCGGSRARAYAATGDPLGEDPACPFQL